MQKQKLRKPVTQSVRSSTKMIDSKQARPRPFTEFNHEWEANHASHNIGLERKVQSSRQISGKSASKDQRQEILPMSSAMQLRLEGTRGKPFHVKIPGGASLRKLSSTLVHLGVPTENIRIFLEKHEEVFLEVLKVVASNLKKSRSDNLFATLKVDETAFASSRCRSGNVSKNRRIAFHFDIDYDEYWEKADEKQRQSLLKRVHTDFQEAFNGSGLSIPINAIRLDRTSVARGSWQIIGAVTLPIIAGVACGFLVASFLTLPWWGPIALGVAAAGAVGIGTFKIFRHYTHKPVRMLTKDADEQKQIDDLATFPNEMPNGQTTIAYTVTDDTSESERGRGVSWVFSEASLDESGSLEVGYVIVSGSMDKTERVDFCSVKGCEHVAENVVFVHRADRVCQPRQCSKHNLHGKNRCPVCGQWICQGDARYVEKVHDISANSVRKFDV